VAGSPVLHLDGDGAALGAGHQPVLDLHRPLRADAAVAELGERAVATLDERSLHSDLQRPAGLLDAWGTHVRSHHYGEGQPET
jgi:hypothetical protein